MPDKILLIDDEPAILTSLSRFLRAKGFEVSEATSCTTGVQAYANSLPDVVVMDYRLGDGDALALIPLLRSINASAPLIVLTGYGTIELAVKAVKLGADQFLTKPVELPTLVVLIERALANRRALKLQAANESLRSRRLLDPFTGVSAAISSLREDATRARGIDRPVLILGETGTGKGVLAEWLHYGGRRAVEAFVDLNCAGFSTELLESELFGHKKGAFTSALSDKPGLFEIAHRGTVFLDEIGDLPLSIQPKLLKVLEDRSFRKLGDVQSRRVDIALIAATHQDLTGLASKGKFRPDLYFRISTIPLRIPALRERPEDIPLIAAQILARLALDLGWKATLASDAVASLQTYAWPGNVRELRNVLERAILLSGKEVLAAQDLRFDPLAPTTRAAMATVHSGTLATRECEAIKAVIAETGGNVRRAASILGIGRSSLYAKIKRFGISLSTPEQDRATTDE